MLVSVAEGDESPMNVSPRPFSLLTELRRIKSSRTSENCVHQKFATRKQRPSYGKDSSFGDVPSTPLWWYGEAKIRQAQGRGFEPRPTEGGHLKGVGSQWCNRLPSIPLEVGEEGVE